MTCMLPLIAQLVAFLVALIGTFFKCVKEDAHEKPLRSSWGLPVLTKPGVCILTLLIASFVSSLWLTHASSKEMSDLRTNLAAARGDLTASLIAEKALSLQLKGANDEIQARQSAAQIDNVSRLNEVTQKLENSSDLLSGRIRKLSPVQSFRLILFFDGMKRPTPWSGATDSRPSGVPLQPGDSPGLYYGMLCGSGSSIHFNMQISSHPDLVFHSMCGLTELTGGAWGLSVYMKPVYEQWVQDRQGMFAEFVESSEYNANSKIEGLTLNSFSMTGKGFASMGIDEAGPVSALARFEQILPKYVGFGVSPNGERLDPQLITMYGTREPAEVGAMRAFAFIRSSQCRLRPEWRGISRYTGQTVDGPVILSISPSQR
ncbi:MAG: hypothetical protein JOY62_08485 [Acidobacteriaceae bacterium]|nr:hypothetical protein [Acidobacteriaceae bacterium]